MAATATKVALPDPARPFTYTRRVPQPDGSIVVRTSSATCEGGRTHNGFYGSGVIDATKAVGGRDRSTT